MVFAFGINMPVIEIMLVVTLLFLVGIGFMIWQILMMRTHMEILEKTTKEIEEYEQEEKSDVQRFESDVRALESDEAEFFVSKLVPSVMKMQNYAAKQLVNGKQPDDVVKLLIQNKVEKTLANQIVSSVTFYLKTYDKLPQKQHDQHVKVAEKL